MSHISSYHESSTKVTYTSPYAKNTPTKQLFKMASFDHHNKETPKKAVSRPLSFVENTENTKNQNVTATDQLTTSKQQDIPSHISSSSIKQVIGKSQTTSEYCSPLDFLTVNDRECIRFEKDDDGIPFVSTCSLRGFSSFVVDNRYSETYGLQSDFVSRFFLTHRWFMPSSKLLAHLFHQIQSLIQKEDFGTTSGFVSLIFQWLSKFSEHWSQDPLMIPLFVKKTNQTLRLLNNIHVTDEQVKRRSRSTVHCSKQDLQVQLTELLVQRRKLLFYRQSKSAASSSHAKMQSTSVTTKLVERNSRTHHRRKRPFIHLNHQQWSPKKFAQQMMLFEGRLFRQLDLDQLRRKITGDDDNTSSSFNDATAMIQKSNNMIFGLAEQILVLDKVSDRASLIKFLISAGKYCAEYGNFSGVMEIIGALNITAVSRLKDSFAQVPAKYQVYRNRLEQLMNSANNFAAYRDRLRQCLAEPNSSMFGLVPFLGVALKDLTALDQTVPYFVQCEGHKQMNVVKMLLLGKHLRELVACQSKCASRTMTKQKPVPWLQHFFQTTSETPTQSPEDYLYGLSLKQRPLASAVLSVSSPALHTRTKSRRRRRLSQRFSTNETKQKRSRKSRRRRRDSFSISLMASRSSSGIFKSGSKTAR